MSLRNITAASSVKKMQVIVWPLTYLRYKKLGDAAINTGPKLSSGLSIRALDILWSPTSRTPRPAL